MIINMSVIKLYTENPTDGILSFDKVRFYEANDSVGTGSTLVTTIAIDLSRLNPTSPGFTAYTYPGGSVTKYYASTWYNSVTFTETDKSLWVMGGTDRWDTRFMNELKDTVSAVWDATTREYFKDSALESFYPDFSYETVDTSLLVVNNNTVQTKSYAVPFGIFHISEVGVGDPNDLTKSFVVVNPSNWQFEKNLLRFNSLSGMTDTYPIRLVCGKKYLSVGEVPEKLDQIAMLHMKMDAYLNLADDYPRFLTWAKLQAGTKVSFENLRVHAREFERKFEKEKKRLADMLESEERI